MSHASLTARYRPQCFAEVAGQDTLKAILSRASRENKVAPAYLFSGTRGVGKTTLARIFAKALNCRTAPVAEPCNSCDQCRAVTQGNAVDVVEIDGASNRGIDDVRRLKEVVGYAPMEGRYKVFIIDEAHMLSREAFNALLKTLEEPPAKVTFIMATTEPHKFPATIISRCQHHVFKRLPEQELMAHLKSVLERESLDYEESAVRLIARRGAGSVRDSMSLLGQVLALGAGKLTEDTARGVLGLAGQEAFFRILETCRDGDSLSLVELLRDLLDQGLDMGFFLRELGALWRNLFILRQSGEAGARAVALPEAEARVLLDLARSFSLAHIHACWQMTLEGQRRVLTSLEPAQALELLLLNLAMLPQLLSLEQVSVLGRRSGSGVQNGGAFASPACRPQSRPGEEARSAPNPSGQPNQPSQADPSAEKKTSEAGPLKDVRNRQASPAGTSSVRTDEACAGRPGSSSASAGTGLSRQPAAPAREHASEMPGVNRPTDKDVAPVFPGPSAAVARADEPAPAKNPTGPADRKSADGRALLPGQPTPVQPGWNEILDRAAELQAPVWFLALARKTGAEWVDGTLVLRPRDAFTGQQLAVPEAVACLEQALTSLCGVLVPVSVRAPEQPAKQRGELKHEVLSHPLVQLMEETFDARIVDFGQQR